MFKALFAHAVLCVALIYSAEPFNVKFGYLLQNVSALDSKDIQLGYTYVASRFAKRYNVHLDIIYDTDGKEVITKFISNDLQYLGLQTSSLASFYDQLDPYIGEVVVTSSGNSLMESYVILTNSPKAKTLHDLQGKRALLQEKEGNAITYADTVSLETFHKRYNEMFELHTASSPQRCILMLFFNQADLAFVPLRSWEIAKTLNPTLDKTIRVLETSPQSFSYGIELYQKNNSPEMVKLAHQSNYDITTTKDGQQLMKILKVKKRVQISKEELKNMLSYYMKYQRLLSAYKGKK